ncbi:hypothetical protein [Haloferax sp. YSMS24]|uniref:hypothetical protein n=1 Tax=Haloferax sp. YSMS24 TaxID=3388425 RepID=UPI00398D1DC2
MNVVGYGAFVGLCLVVAAVTKWLDPAGVAHLSRQTGLSRKKGWAVLLVALLWTFFPVLAGADIDDGKLWVATAAVGGAGFFLTTIAAGSLDEYRLLERVPYVEPRDVSSSESESVVATSGVPETLPGSEADEFETPFSGRPAVHTNWVVQRRDRLGFREVWRNVAGGVRSVEFGLGSGAVRVTPGRHRVFSSTERTFTVDLGDTDVSERVATFLREHPELPSPDESDEELKIVERFVPADDDVTVVGTVEQTREPGVVRIDGGPIDELLGTHTDHSVSSAADAEAVLIRGDVDHAKYTMHKRVYWLGPAGVAMILGGQLLSFWFSGASLSALL